MDLELQRPPSPLAAYARALLGARKPVRAGAAPALSVTVRRVAVDAAHVGRYRAVCGAPAAGPVPPAYPQVLALPLHLRLLTDDLFPLRLLGAVHLRNVIDQRRPLRAGEHVDLRATLAAFRDTPRGTEHDTVTEVRDAQGALVWTATSTALSRDPAAPPRTGAPREAPPPPPGRERALPVPRGVGLAYGRVSGDLNPIHLHALTARPFGYPRPIAHGMWTVARVLAVLEEERPLEAATIEAAFRKPLYVPSEAVLHWRTAGDVSTCSVRGVAADVVHLDATVTRR